MDVTGFFAGVGDEAAMAFDRRPAACWIARANPSLAGFCAYDATARGQAGPIGGLNTASAGALAGTWS